MATIGSGTNAISRSIDLLRAGEVIGFPTETVYGLGADAENPAAVRKVYALKGRPEWHPLIVHISPDADLSYWARDVPEIAKQLAKTFWPGPLTVVLARHKRVPDVVTGGRDTVALRVPSHNIAQELLVTFGRGIAAPSANRFGAVSPTTAQHVAEEFSDTDLYTVDGGPSAVGLESTIVRIDNEDTFSLLRPGAISEADIHDITGARPVTTQDTDAHTPGSLPSHYSPRAKVLLSSPQDLNRVLDDALSSHKTVAIITEQLPATSQSLPTGDTTAQVLTPTGTTGPQFLTPTGTGDTAFAHEMYDRLREADHLGVDAVVVIPPTRTTMGLNVAIWDRLTRAAHVIRRR